jgi:hypothetical protein
VLGAVLLTNSNKMNDMKTFKRKETEFEIGSFDNDKEVEFCMSTDQEKSVTSTWLTPNQVNELINHLAQCLRSINEPIELLEVE